jgi:hypothetical protein
MSAPPASYIADDAGVDVAGEPAPPGPARRSAKPPLFPLAAIDDPALPEMLAELAAARADEMEVEPSTGSCPSARKAIGWWQRQGWIVSYVAAWSLLSHGEFGVGLGCS